jgi:hypothetical protein
MNSRLRQTASIIAITVMLTACHRVEPIYDIANSPISVSVDHKYTQEKVGEIITQAALSKGWLVEKVKPGVLRATIKWKEFSAVSSIHYSKTDYSIQLVSSDNLDQKDGKIHHKYNEYVKALQNDIDKNLSSSEQ